MIVHDSLKTQPGEKVIIHADPTYSQALTEQVRIELARAGAVELSVQMVNSGGLEAVRRSHRRREDPVLVDMEDKAMASMFDLADIYIWLPSFWLINPGQTEKILKTWPGRSIHFNWVIDPNDPVEFGLLSEMYEKALFIYYAALDFRQLELIATLCNSTVQITNPAGRYLPFTLLKRHTSTGAAAKPPKSLSPPTPDRVAHETGRWICRLARYARMTSPMLKDDWSAPAKPFSGGRRERWSTPLKTGASPALSPSTITIMSSLFRAFRRETKTASASST